MQLQRCPPGDVICKYGDVGHTFYVLLEGGVSVSIPNPEDGKPRFIVVATLKPGATFGELALMKEQPRAATVTAVQETILGVLEKEDFDKILKVSAEDMLNSKVAFLRSAPLFEKLSKQGLTKLAYYFKEVRYPRGHCLYAEGAPATEVFLIRSGEVEFLKNHSVSEPAPINLQSLIGPRTGSRDTLPLRRLLSRKEKTRKSSIKLCVKGTREMFGEEEVLRNLPRKSSAYCISQEAIVFSITKADFLRRMQNPEIWTKLTAINQVKEAWLKERIEDLGETELFIQQLSQREKRPSTAAVKQRKASVSPVPEKSAVYYNVQEDEMEANSTSLFHTEVLDLSPIPHSASSPHRKQRSTSPMFGYPERPKETVGNRLLQRKPRFRESRKYTPPPNFHGVATVASRYRQLKSEYSGGHQLGSYDAKQFQTQKQLVLSMEKKKRLISPSKHNLFRMAQMHRASKDKSGSPESKDGVF